MKKLWMSWSTGKDSAFALLELSRNPAFAAYDACGLFTTVNESNDRVAMHSTRVELLRLQAEALGLPLEIVRIPDKCPNSVYEAKMAELIAKASAAGITAFGFGDLFLEDIRGYREHQLAGSGIEAVFPLWGKDTAALAREMWESGLEAVITCVDPAKLPPAFAGQPFRPETLASFPPGIDPCGENGEFHTFVSHAPNFRARIPASVGETVERGGFFFADVKAVANAEAKLL